MIKIVQEDITKMNVDVFVNAANGIGFMGGLIGRIFRFSGVAESIGWNS